MRTYLSLTKPRISLLFALTGLAAMMVEGSLREQPWVMWSLVLALFLVGGSANAFNQYFEREVDSRMARTARKRALPRGLITPPRALAFSIAIGVGGTALLWWGGGTFAALLGLGTILYYSFYYTLWLKPRTPYNIVIGGVAGSTAPLIGWAAAAGTIAWAPVLMFLLIFFWTPPHFWSLALCCKEDYRAVGYPMLPLVCGDEATRRQILGYAGTLLPLSLGLAWVGHFGPVYVAAVAGLGAGFLWGAWRVWRQPSIRANWQLFGYSILYVFLLFLAMIVDVLL